VERVATRQARRASRTVRKPTSRTGRSWRVLLATLVVVVSILLALIGHGRGGPRPTPFEARIVAIAKSQIGYRTDPVDTYCNRFSAFWGAGAATCPPGERAEQWCADFAAWVWRKAGARFRYGYGPGEINGSAASFYAWAIAHHRWHLAKGYDAAPGDVAVYGLDKATMTAVHVAIVTSDPPGSKGPNVINGDGSRTGFSVVEAGTDQYKAAVRGDGGRLSGYVVPLLPTRPRLGRR
jgi:hypothetical protein